MRALILLVALALITSCRSHRELQRDKSVAVDSVARSENHRSTAVVDSIIRNIDFSFDTLKINIERPVEYAEIPEVVRVTAVKGRVINQQSVYRDSVESFNRLDTVAYRKSAAEASTEHSATTRLYNPPNGTLIVIATILVAGCLICVFYRKR